MRKKAKIIVLSVICVIVVALAAVGVWQRENIISIINSFRYSEEQLSTKIESNNKKLEKIVEETDYIDIRGGLTPEEEQALASGEITAADAINLVRGKTSLEEIRNGAQTQQPVGQTPEQSPEQTSGNTASEPPPEQNEPQQTEKEPEPTKTDIMTDEVSNIVAELYVVKADFLAQLSAVGDRAYEDYVAGGGGSAQLTAIMDQYMTVAASLETTCDQKVNTLLSNLEAALKKGGGDLTLVNQIRQYYYNEKSLKKSYYLNKIYG